MNDSTARFIGDLGREIFERSGDQLEAQFLFCMLHYCAAFSCLAFSAPHCIWSPMLDEGRMRLGPPVRVDSMFCFIQYFETFGGVTN